LRINRAFSLRGRKKFRKKESTLYQDERKRDGNIPVEIPEGKESKEVTVVQDCNETKQYASDIALEVENSKHPDNELNKMVDSYRKDSNETEHSKSNAENQSRLKDNFSINSVSGKDSILDRTKVLYVETVVETCLDYLIKTVEANMSTTDTKGI
jgi:uncharacterized Ntn-hydrolase superfamily protein